MSAPRNTHLRFWKGITVITIAVKATWGDYVIQRPVWNKYNTRSTSEATLSLLSAQNILFYICNLVFMEAYNK